jgi:hypothetical protein
MLENFNQLRKFYEVANYNPITSPNETYIFHLFLNLFLSLNIELHHLEKNSSYKLSLIEFEGLINAFVDLNIFGHTVFLKSDGLNIKKKYDEKFVNQLFSIAAILDEREDKDFPKHQNILEEKLGVKNRKFKKQNVTDNELYILKKVGFRKKVDTLKDLMVRTQGCSNISIVTAIKKYFTKDVADETFVKDFFIEYIELCKNPHSSLELRLHLFKNFPTLVNFFAEKLTLLQLQSVLTCVKLNDEEKKSIMTIPKLIEYNKSINFKSSFKNAFIIYEYYISLYSNEFFMLQPENIVPNFNDILETFSSMLIHLEIKTKNFPKENILNSLPIFMQTIIMGYDEKIEKKFLELVKVFNKINEKAPQHYQKDFFKIFSLYSLSMAQYIKVMGIEGLNYLHKQMAHTVLPLERVLLTFPLLPEILITELSKFFKALTLITQKREDIIELFRTIIVTINILLPANSNTISNHINELIDILKNTEKNKTGLTELLNLLSKKVIQEISGELHTRLSTGQINNICSRISHEKIIKLIAASQRMEKDKYRAVFLELLIIDLTEDDVDKFLHDLDQENPLGKAIALHNQRIREILESYEFKMQPLINYSEKHEIVIFPEGFESLDKSNAIFALWKYIIKLEETLIENSKNITKLSTINTIKNIGKLIERLKNNMRAHNNNAIEIAHNLLSHSNNKDIIKNVLNKIEILLLNNTELTSKFKEFSQYIKDQSNILENFMKENNFKKNKIEHFRIIQWPKQQFETFFLGDYVKCCLATNNEQFPAIVQRRIDDAILFHVAIDLNTKTPVALIWLYLAKTFENEIILMANFFEVDTKYALSNSTRLGLLNGLLKFAYDYCEYNGLAAFYMNQLKYGSNIHDLTQYPLVKLNLGDKVGGPFIPHEDFQTDGLSTKKIYYLVSLEEEYFHKFDLAILEKNIKNTNMKTKQEIIQTCIEFIMKDLNELEKKSTVETIKQIVIDKHRIELAPFYENSLENDQDFTADVSLAIEKFLLQKKSLIKQASNEIREASRILRNSPELRSPYLVQKSSKKPQEKTIVSNRERSSNWILF